jgi:hypothetical protein
MTVEPAKQQRKRLSAAIPQRLAQARQLSRIQAQCKTRNVTSKVTASVDQTIVQTGTLEP